MHVSRRQFIAGTVSASLVSIAGQSLATGGYELISPPQNTSDPSKVEVLEFFWLGCHHCYAFEPLILDWKKNMPENVVFVQEAPPLNASWEQHSRSFYAAQLMGKGDEFVDAMFKAIHEDRQRMRKPDDIADLAAEMGLDRDKFLATMKSFAVETKLKRSIQLAKGAGITGVPAIMVNGKYRTSASLAGGNQGMINVINDTVAIEKAAMGLE